MSRVIFESEKRITNQYGNGHGGVDLGYRPNEEQNKVHANCEGIVAEIQTGIPTTPGSTGTRSWGNYVLVKHPNGMYSRYCHLREVYVSKGQGVNENTCIGLIGESGNAYGRHLHFEVQTGYSSSTRINPTEYLTKAIYTKPAPVPKPTPQPTSDFKVGDRVVVKGYATASSDGTGSRTATYGGNANDPSDIRYITKINIGSKRSYHISVGNTLGNQDRGWVSKDQIKKI